MQRSSRTISDLGRQSLIAKLGNYGDFTHIFFVDNDVSIPLADINDLNIWINLYFDGKLYPVKDLMAIEDLSEDPTYERNVFGYDDLTGLGLKTLVFSLMPDSDKIRDLFTITNQPLSFYLGDVHGQLYGLIENNTFYPYPADLIVLEPPKFGQGATPTFTKLRTQISEAQNLVEKFYTEEVDFDLDDVDKRIVNIETFIYSQTNVRIKVTYKGVGVTDIQASDITFNDNRYGELSVSIIQNTGDGNYSLLITDGILTDGTIRIFSGKYIGCDRYIVTSVTPIIVNYDFEDGSNYQFEDGTNFDFNG